MRERLAFPQFVARRVAGRWVVVNTATGEMIPCVNRGVAVEHAARLEGVRRLLGAAP